MTRNRIVFGLTSTKIREKLIQEDDKLTLDKAIEITSMHKVKRNLWKIKKRTSVRYKEDKRANYNMDCKTLLILVNNPKIYTKNHIYTRNQIYTKNHVANVKIVIWIPRVQPRAAVPEVPEMEPFRERMKVG
ncbi:hypothetical protein DPMN_160546 [Dreissena polymorpha]|uniref:Uncharacterized protein n=1 Tax=Dreissena polymorpha TaxID=45954 RepID=A0A9D4ERF3_DREPO|nr:hypothetical protein DPMN_160546 [Dreissena polymorpha]